jgi:hypothetical protein
MPGVNRPHQRLSPWIAGERARLEPAKRSVLAVVPQSERAFADMWRRGLTSKCFDRVSHSRRLASGSRACGCGYGRRFAFANWSYSRIVSGAHRGTTQSGVTYVRKSAGWLATGLGIVLIPLALLAVVALAIYFALTRKDDAFYAAAAMQSVALFLWLGDLISQLRKPSRSPEWLVAVIRKAWLPTVVAIGLLIDVGQTLGWHGSALYALAGISGLVVLGYLAFSFGGERRLLALLQARAAGRGGPA